MRRLLPKRFQYAPVALGHTLADWTVIVGVCALIAWWAL